MKLLAFLTFFSCFSLFASCSPSAQSDNTGTPCIQICSGASNVLSAGADLTGAIQSGGNKVLHNLEKVKSSLERNLELQKRLLKEVKNYQIHKITQLKVYTDMLSYEMSSASNR